MNCQQLVTLNTQQWTQKIFSLRKYRKYTPFPCDIDHVFLKWWVFGFFQGFFFKIYSITEQYTSLSPIDIRCWWEPDGPWWVHHRGEADRDVVEAPGCRWRSRSCFQNLHGPPGQTQSHDAGRMINSSLSLSLNLKADTEQRVWGTMILHIQVTGSLGTRQCVEFVVETLILVTVCIGAFILSLWSIWPSCFAKTPKHYINHNKTYRILLWKDI